MPTITALLNNIRRIMKLYDRFLKPVCDSYGLQPIEATIISFLYNNPSVDTAADIAELRMLSKSNVSKAVESLIQKSLLQRRQDADDRRRIHLSLTSSATPITGEIELAREAFREKVFAGFSQQEREQFLDLNERIAQNLKPESGKAQ